jgi:CheY-like chemotaxis protein
MQNPAETPQLGNPITILMADDSLDDCKLAQIVLREARLANEIRFVHSGEDLLNYLRREGDYADGAETPRPGLILLDLNMPRKDGLTVLKEMKADPDLRNIPVVALTLSNAEEDISGCIEAGASAYLIKPVRMEGLLDILQMLNNYWFDIIEELPE